MVSGAPAAGIREVVAVTRRMSRLSALWPGRIAGPLRPPFSTSLIILE